MAAFANFSGVNDTALHVAVSEWIIERLVQESFYRDGLGLKQLTTKDVGAGGVRVPKVKPSTGKWRKLGATTNGDWFNANNSGVIGLDEEFVELLYTYDAYEDVPVAQQKLALGGLSNVQVRANEIGKNIAIGLNSGTMALQMEANINAVLSAGAQDDYIFTYDAAGTDSHQAALAEILDANASLDNGDGTYHAYFPRGGRILLLRPRAIANLRKKGAVIVGGSNYAQEILKTGALDIDVDELPEINYGYVGMLDGIPVFKATQLYWNQAETWMGVPAGYLDNIVGILASDYSTGRGHAFPDMTKVIDSPSGQGLRIQPLSNFGGKVFFPKGIKLIADGTFDETAGATVTGIEVIPEGSQA
jgi:hypothetical protein